MTEPPTRAGADIGEPLVPPRTSDGMRDELVFLRRQFQAACAERSRLADFLIAEYPDWLGTAPGPADQLETFADCAIRILKAVKEHAAQAKKPPALDEYERLEAPAHRIAWEMVRLAASNDTPRPSTLIVWSGELLTALYHREDRP